MLSLVALTHPGPFRPRTHTLGTYLGIHVEGRLAAMAGQRMHLPGWREVSAVCTHPAVQGRGYTRTLIARLVAAIRDEGLTPFLHVEESNVRAQEVYAALGFVERKRLPLLVIERASGWDYFVRWSLRSDTCCSRAPRRRRGKPKLANVHNESVTRHSAPIPEGTWVDALRRESRLR